MIYNFNCKTIEQNGCFDLDEIIERHNFTLHPKKYVNKCLALSIYDALINNLEIKNNENITETFYVILNFLEKNFGDNIFDTDINQSNEIYDILLNLVMTYKIYISFIPCIKIRENVTTNNKTKKLPVNIGDENDTHIYIASFNDNHFEAIYMKSIEKNANDANDESDEDNEENEFNMKIYEIMGKCTENLNGIESKLDIITNSVKYLESRNYFERKIIDFTGNTTFMERVVSTQKNIKNIISLIDDIEKLLDIINYSKNIEIIISNQYKNLKNLYIFCRQNYESLDERIDSLLKKIS